MPSKKPDRPEESGWSTPQTPTDAAPTTYEPLDFSEQEPPDPSTSEEEAPPPPIRPFARPDFSPPPRASVPSPETIHFGEPPAAPLPGPESAVPPPAPVSAPRSETQMLLEIMSRLVQGQAPVPSSTGMSFEQCADQLLSVFDEHQLNAIRNAAITHTEGSVANWLLALVNVHLDRGTLGEIAYNPDWRRQIQASQQVGTQHYTPPAISRCELCGHSFRPPLGGNVRQRFCCNVCGKKAAGYGEEPIPHAPDCTTEAAKVIHQALAAAQTSQAKAA